MTVPHRQRPRGALSRASLMVAAALLSVGMSPQLRAANLYWDSDATAAGNNTGTGAGLGGTGNWDTTTANWYNASSDVAWANAGSDTAFFYGTAGTVTLTTPITVGGLNFGATGFTLTGSATNTLTLGGTTPTITLATGVSQATINTLIVGSTGLTFDGGASTGTLFLNSASASTYTGATLIGSGTLRIGSLTSLGASGASNTTTVNSGGALRISVTGTVAAEILSLTGTGVSSGGALVVDSGLAATWSGAITTASGGATINVGANSIFSPTGGLTMTGNLTKSGVGKLTLATTGATGTGTLAINAGTFSITSSAATTFWNGGNITVGSTGTLQTTGSGTDSIGATNLAAITVNAGGVLDWQQTGAETLTSITLNGAGINGTGALTTNAFTAGGAITGTISLASDTTIGALLSGGFLKAITPITGNGFALTKVGLGSFIATPATTGTLPFGDGNIVLKEGTLAIAPSLAIYAGTGASALVGSTFTYSGGGILGLTKSTSLSYTIGNAAPTGTVLSRSGKGTLVIAPTALANLGASELFVVNGLSSSSNTNGIYNPSVVAMVGNIGTFVRYSATATNGFQDAVTATSSYTPAVTATTILANTVSDVTSSVTINAASNPYALRVGAFTLTNSGTTTVGNGSGQAGLIMNSTATASTITGGTLAFGASEGVIFAATSGAGNATIASAISGSAGITKFGPGALVLGGTNTFTGGVYINQGTLSVVADTNLGDAANGITFNAAANLTISSLTGVTFARAIALSNSTPATITISTASAIITISGPVTGTGGLTLLGGTTAATLTLSSASNAFTGPLRITGAAINSTISLASIGDSSVNPIIFGGIATATSTLTYTGSGVTLARPIEFAGTTVGGTINANGTGALNLTGDLVISQAGVKQLLLNGTYVAATNTLSGRITNDNAGNAMGITFVTGNFTLSGANTYSGATTVTAGTHFISGDMSGSSTAITINGGALTISGTSPTGATTLSGGSLSITGTGGAGATTINGGTLSVSGTGGTGAVVINSTGTYKLSGAAAGINNAPITVNAGGTLTVDNTAGSGGVLANRLNSKALTLVGGVFNYNFGGSATAATDNIGTLTVGAGSGYNSTGVAVVPSITLAAATSGASSVTIASLARQAGGTLLISGPNLGTAAAGTGNTNVIITANAASAEVVGGTGLAGTTTISINPFIVGQNTSLTGNAQFGFMTDKINTVILSNGLRNLVGGTEYATTLTSGENSTKNVNLSADVVGINSATTVNSLRLDQGTRISGTGTLTVTSGGILALGNTTTFSRGANSISGGTLAFGAQEAIFHTIYSDFTVGSAITGSGGLTKTGDGSLTLTSASNAISGPMTIASGILRPLAAGAIDTTGALVIANRAGAILDLTGMGTPTFGFSATVGSLATAGFATGGTVAGGQILLGNGGTLTVGSDGTSTTYNGVISGNGNFAKAGSAGTLTLAGANLYTGTTSVAAGSTLKGGIATFLPKTTTVTLIGSGILDLGSYSTTISGLSGDAGSSIINSVGGNSALTLGPDAGVVNSTYSGQFGTGTSLIKFGGGILTLNANAAGTGPSGFSLYGGVLKLDYTGLTNNGNIAAQANVTLYGGVLSVKGRSGATVVQTVGTLALKASGGQIIMEAGGGVSTTLSGAFTPTIIDNGGSLLITAPATTFVKLAVAITAAAPPGRVVFSDGTSYNWATNAGNQATALSGGVTYGSNLNATTFGATSDSANSLIAVATANQTTTTSSTWSTHTLKIDTTLGGATGGTLSLGGSLTLDATGGILFTGANDYTISGGNIVSALTVASDVVIHAFGDGRLLLNSPLAASTGVATFTKGGSGTVVVGSAVTNLYTGATYINAGALSISTNAALGATAAAVVNIADGATLQVTGGATLTTAHVLNLPGGMATLDLKGAGTQLTAGGVNTGAGGLLLINSGSGTSIYNPTAASTFTGNILIGTSGTGNVKYLQGANSLTANDRTVTVGPNGSIDMNGFIMSFGALSGSGSVYNSGPVFALTIGGNNLDSTYSGVLQSTGAAANLNFVKNGAGTFTLNAAALYTGVTTVGGGIFRLGVNEALTGALGVGTTIVVGNVLGPASVTLDINGKTQTLQGASTVLTMDGSTSTNTTEARVTIGSGGNLILKGNLVQTVNATPSSGFLGAFITGGTLTLDGAARLFTIAESLNAADDLTITSVVATANAGSLTKAGAGTLALTGNNTMTGATLITLGTLRIEGTNNSSAFNLNTAGAVLAASGPNATVGSLTGIAGTTVNLNGTLTVGADNTSPAAFAGTITGAGNLVKTGSGLLTLSGASVNYTGATTVSAGTLSLTGSTGAALVTTGLTVAGGATFKSVNTVGQPINLGSGVLALGTASQMATLSFDIGASAVLSDTFTTTGAAAVAGTVKINVTPLAGFSYSNGTSVNLLTAASGLSGATYLAGGLLPGGYNYSFATSTDTVVQLTLSTAPAGDLFWRGDLGGSWSALGNWDTLANGTSAAIYNPGTTNTVNFSTSTNAGGAFVTTLDNNFTVNDLKFSNGSSSPTTLVTIAAGTSGSLTITPSSSSAGITIAAGAATTGVTISAPVILGAAQTWTVADAGVVLTLSGVVSGGLSNSNQTTPAQNTSFTIKGAGSVTLSGGANTFTGDIVVDGGGYNISSVSANYSWGGATVANTTSKTISLINGGRLNVTSGTPNPNNTTNYYLIQVGTGGGTIDIASGATLQLDDANQLWGTGNLTKTGAGIFLSGLQATFSGTITISGGLLRAGNASGVFGVATAGTTISSGAALDLNGKLTITEAEPLTISGAGLAASPAGVITNNSATAAIFPGPITLAADSTISAPLAGNITLTGGISGPYGLTINNPSTGTVTLTGASSFTGPTVLAAGTLNLNLAVGFETLSGNLTLNAGTILNHSGAGLTTLSGTTSNSGTINITAGGINFLKKSALAGTVNVSSGATIGLGVSSTDGTTFTSADVDKFLNTSLTAYTGVTGNATQIVGLDTTLGDFTYATNIPALTMGLSKLGANTLTLSGVSAYNGGTTVAAGTLSLTGSLTTSGNILVAAGTFNLANTGSLTTTGNITLNTGTLNLLGTVTGSATTTSTFITAGAAVGTSFINVSGNLTASGLTLGSVAGSTSIYNQTAGTVSMGYPNDANSNNVSSAGYGYFNLTGGAYSVTASRFTVSSGTGTGVAYIGGDGQGGTGTLNVKGSNGYIFVGYSGIGSMTVGSGGSVVHDGAGKPFCITWSSNSTGILNLAGGTISTTSQPLQALANANGATGFLNLAGGTLSTGVAVTNAAGPGTGNIFYINLAGATIKTTAAVTSLLPATNAFGTVVTTAFGAIDNSALGGASTSFAGGLTIDTNGFAVTLGTNLISASGAGVTQANLIVSGGAGYIGAPAVVFSTAGVIAGGTPASGYALISNGSVTGIVITSPGTYTAGTVPTITLTGGGWTTQAAATVTALNALNTTGDLTKAGLGTLTLTGNMMAFTGKLSRSAGLITVGSGGILNATSLIGMNSGRTLSIAAGGVLNLNYDAASDRVISDAVLSNAATSMVGSVGITSANAAHAIDLSAAGLYLPTASFGAVGGDVTYTGTYTPATADNYRLGGGAGTGILTYTPVISGTTSRVTIANGSVILTGTNTYGGGTNLAGGTLILPSATTASNFAFSSGSTLNVTATSTLQWGAGSTFDLSVAPTQTFTNSPGAANAGLNFTAGTLTLDTNGNNITFANPVGYGFAGGFTKTGTGSLTLNAATSLAQPFTASASVTAGTLILGNADALRQASVTVGVANGLTFAAGIGTFTLGSLAGATSTGNLVLTDSASAAITLQVGRNNSSTTFAGVMSGAGGLTKTGVGILTLATNPQTYTGPTIITGGSANTNVANNASGATLSKILVTFTAPATNFFNPNSALIFGSAALNNANPGGGALAFKAQSPSETNTQTFTNTTVAGGWSTLSTTYNSSGTNGYVINLTLTNLARTGVTVTGTGTEATATGGGLINFAPSGQLLSTSTISTTRVNDATGILGAWAFFGSNDFATVSGGQLVAFTGYTDITTTGVNLTSSPTSLVRINTLAAIASTTTASATTDLADIYMGSAMNATHVIALGAGSTLRLGYATGTGAILLASGGRRIQIGSAANNGVLTAGNASTSELILVSGAAATSGGPIAINSTIADNGLGPALTVIKGGTGEAYLYGANTYTGGTIVQQGRVWAADATVFGTGTVVIQPGGQVIVSQVTLANNFIIGGTGLDENPNYGAIRGYSATSIINGNVTLVADASIGPGVGLIGAVGLTLNGNITGAYSLAVAGGTSNLSQVVLNGTNTYTGQTLVSGGNLILGTANTSAWASLPAHSVLTSLLGTVTPYAADLATFQSFINTQAHPASTGAFALSDSSITTGTIDYAAAGLAGAYLAAGNLQTITFTGTYVPGTAGQYRFGGGDGVLNYNTVIADIPGGSRSSVIIGLSSNGSGAFGVTSLGGTNTFTGGVTLAGSALQVGSLSSLGSPAPGVVGLTSTGGNFGWATGTTFDLSAVAGGVTMTSGTLYLDLNGSNVTFTQGMGNYGAGTLQKNTNGTTLTLNATSTFTGNTTVQGGTLILGTSNPFNVGYSPAGTASAATVGPNNLANTFLQLGASATIGSLISVNSDIRLLSLGQVSLAGYTLTLAGTASSTMSGNLWGGIGVPGSGGITKIGSGTVTFSSNLTATYTGDTTILGGTLLLDYSQVTATQTTIISNSSPLVLGGGTLSMKGKGAGITSSQIFNGLTLTAGASAFTTTLNSATGLNLTLGAITRTVAGSAVDFAVSTLGSGTVTTATANSGSTGILGGYATVNAGADFATAAGAGPYALAAYTSYTFTYTAGANVANGSLTTIGGSALSINSLRFNSPSAISLDATGGLTLASGGLLVTPTVAANNTTITGGTLTSGNGLDLIVHQYSTGILTVASQITGSVGLTKAGPGVLAVNNATNNFTGAVNLGGSGALKVLVTGALSSGQVNLNSAAQLQIVAGVNLANNITINNASGLAAVGALNFTGASGSATFSGNITVNNSVAAGGVFGSAGGTLNVTGKVTAAAGQMVGVITGNVVFANGTADSSYDYFAAAGGTTFLGGHNGLAAGAIVEIAGAGTAGIDLSGYNQTVAGLMKNNANTATVTNSNLTTLATLTLNVAASNGGIFTGDFTYGGTLSGNLALVKSGVGTETLTGANTFTGGTTINGGTLRVKNAGALGVDAGGLSPAIIVNSGGTLDLFGLGAFGAGSLSSASSGGIITDNGGTAGQTLLSVSSSANTTFGGSLNDGDMRSLAFFKDGSGTLTLTGASNYSGLTRILAGALNIRNANALGTAAGATSVSDGAALQLQGGLSTAEPFTLAGTGGGTGVVRNISGANIVSGLVSLASAVRINADSGTLTVSGGVTSNNFALTVGGAGSTVISGSVALGSGGLTKDGAGELTLSGANTYQGSTTVGAGKLTVASLGDGTNASSLGISTLTDSTKLVVGSGATLNIATNTPQTTARSLTLASTAVLSSSGTAAVNFTSAAKFSLSGANPTLNLSGIGAGDNTFGASLDSGTNPIATVVKDGIGTWVLAGATNRFKGDVRIEVAGGTLGLEGSIAQGMTAQARLVISHDSFVTVRWVTGNTSDLSSNLSFGAGADATLSMTDHVVLSGPMIFPNGSSVALTKSGAGTLTIGGDNSLFAGTFTQSGGTTVISQGANHALGSAAVAIAGGRVLVNATITNDVTVGAGTLGGTGTIGSLHAGAAAIVSPGNSPGLLTVTGDAYLVGGTTFTWQVQDGTDTLKYDHFDVGGTLNLTGASSTNRVVFKVISLDGATGLTAGGIPANFPAQSTMIFNVGTIAGLNTGGANISDLFSFDLSQFQYTDGGPLTGSWSMDWNAGSGGLSLTYTAVPEPSTYGFGIGALALAAAAIRRRRKTPAAKA